MRVKLMSNLRPIVNYDVLPVATDEVPILLNNRELHILRQLTYPYLTSGYAAYHPEGYVWYGELTAAEVVSFGQESEILINKLGGGEVVDYLTVAEHTAIANTAPHHAAVTLDSDISPLLSVTAAQVLGLDTEAMNTLLAGPTSGSAAVPTFRALGVSDIFTKGSYGDTVTTVSRAMCQQFTTLLQVGAGTNGENVAARYFSGIIIVAASMDDDRHAGVFFCKYGDSPIKLAGTTMSGTKDTTSSLNLHAVTTYHYLQNRLPSDLNDVVVMSFGRVKSGN